MTCCLNLLMREPRQGLCIAPAGRARFKKTCTKPVPHNWYRFRAISYSLNQFCPVEQLFSSPLRATFERKLKYETVHTIIYPESLPVAGSKGAPCEPVPFRDCGTELAPLPLFSPRAATQVNRYPIIRYRPNPLTTNEKTFSNHYKFGPLSALRAPNAPLLTVNPALPNPISIQYK